MHNSQKTTLRSCCDRFNKHSHAFSLKSTNQGVLKIPCKNKSMSTGIIDNNVVVKPKKTTKSDVIFCKNLSSRYKVNYFDNCGDTKLNTSNSSYSTKSVSKLKDKTNIKNNSFIQQYYKNENFLLSTDSIHANGLEKSPCLNTIKEHTENCSTIESASGYSILDPCLDLDESTVKHLKQFREDNYFECHSAKTRIKSRGSVTSLNDHKCVYRFYLNDRLFPVPINRDYNQNIRCVECHLPLDTESEDINGTIQAKVKLNNEIQDVMVMLPINKTTVLRERRKELKNEIEEDYLYFGIIKLNLNGDSVFNRNVPSDSFALKYQKGYKEFVERDEYKYENIDKKDVIIV